jgi:hypothetical protein
MVRAGTPGKKTSMFFCRVSTFSRKQSFEVDILSSSKKLHIPARTISRTTISIEGVKA